MDMFLYSPDEETTSEKISENFDSHSVRKYKHPQPSVTEFILQKVHIDEVLPFLTGSVVEATKVVGLVVALSKPRETLHQ
jgi:hypothetical protein